MRTNLSTLLMIFFAVTGMGTIVTMLVTGTSDMRLLVLTMVLTVAATASAVVTDGR